MNEASQAICDRIRTISEGPRHTLEQEDLTKAAVLIPIVFRDGELRFILTKRTMTVARHKGQISFPGGVREPEDKDQVENALREADEEVGLDPKHVEVVGMLDDFATVTGYLVTPVVGFVSKEATFRMDPAEVAEIFEAPFSVFTDPENHEFTSNDPTLGSRYGFHSYRHQHHNIWGATAGIIYRFLELLGLGEAAKGH